MKLANAKLCLNCDELYENGSVWQYCPKCTEKHGIMLADYFPILTHHVAAKLGAEARRIKDLWPG